MTAPAFGQPCRIRHTDKTGTFAGVVDRKHGRVRVGTSLRTYPLNDIVTVAPDAGDRWAELHATGGAK